MKLVSFVAGGRAGYGVVEGDGVIDLPLAGLQIAPVISNRAALTLETRLNGQVAQHGTTGLMIAPVCGQIAYLSTILPLLPDDLIVSGTPGGIRILRNPVTAEGHT